MKWSERSIARAVSCQHFNRKHLVLVPNCNWTGHECDVLAITTDLRIIDLEIKISRQDLKADAKKDKWWHRAPTTWDGATRSFRASAPDERRVWPPKVWKHYYVMPRDLWDDCLFEFLPSPASGVLLLSEQAGYGTRAPMLTVSCMRPAKGDKDAERVSPADAVDIARLASLRMWEVIEKNEQAQRVAEVTT